MYIRKMEQQFAYVIQKSTHLGADKHSLKIEHALDDKLVGLEHQIAVKECGKRLGRYLRTVERVGMISDIKPVNIENYLKVRAQTAGINTIDKEKSYLRKIEKCVQSVYRIKTEWAIDSIKIETRDSSYKKDLVFSRSERDAILEKMRTQRSTAWRCVDIGSRVGLRIRECSHLRINSVFPVTGVGQYGHGFVRVIKGPDGGAKGGRPRDIPILTEKDRIEIKAILDGIGDKATFVTEKKDGSRLKTKSVEKQLRNAVIAAGLYEKGNLEHALRKGVAQQVYDKERTSGKDKRQALKTVDAFLGHGDRKNDHKLHNTYVHNQW